MIVSCFETYDDVSKRSVLTQMLFLFFFLEGILYGTMTLELGGQITVACEKTGYSAQLEFKLKVRPCFCTFASWWSVRSRG